MTIQLGIVGFGKSAREIHIPLIRQIDGINIRGVYSPNLKFDPNASFIIYQTDDDLFNDPEIDAVVVTVPHYLHYQCAKKALMSNKHVIIEKPGGYSSTAFLELSRLAKSKNLILSVFYNRIYDSDFLTLKQCIAKNSIGEIFSISYNFYRYHPYVGTKWKEGNHAGSGALYDLGSHMIHQMLELFGSVELISSELYQFRKHSVVCDGFYLILKSHGIRIQLMHDCRVFLESPRFIVMGSEGMLVFTGHCQQENYLKNNRSLDDYEPSHDISCCIQLGNGCSEQITIEQGDWRFFYQKIIHAIKTRHYDIGNEFLTLNVIEQAIAKTVPDTSLRSIQCH